MEPIERFRQTPGGDLAARVAELPPASGSFERVFTWEQAVRVLRKRGRMMVLVAVALTLAVAVYAVTLKNVYQPIARIEVDSMDSGLRTLQEIQYSSGVPDQDYLETQAEILRSQALAVRVIRALHLDRNAEFVGASNGAPPAPPAPVRQRSAQASAVLQDQFDLAERTAAESAALGQLQANLVVTPIRNSRLIDVSYTSHDPAMAQLIINTIVTTFIDQNYRNRYTSTTEASDWLSAQLNDLRQKVDESTRSVVAYQARYGLVEIGNQDLPQSQLMGELNHQLALAQADRIEAEAHGRMIDSGQADALPALREDLLYQNLMTRYAEIQGQLEQARAIYGDENANVKKLLAQSAGMFDQVQAERQVILDRARAALPAAKSREETLLQARDKLRAQMGETSSHFMEFEQLKNEALSNSELYNTLQGRLKEAGIYAGLRSSNIHIVDLAPKLLVATGPHRVFIVVVGAFFSCLFAVVLGLLQESFENTIRTPDDIRECVGLPSLAMLPSMGWSRNWAKGLLGSGSGATPQLTRAIAKPLPQDAQLADCEGMRGLRTSLSVLASRAGVPPCVVLVSSSLIGEGKTTVATNLAISFAQRGRTCLLIDADLRRPRVAEFFGLPSEPGLSDLLNGRATPEGALQQVPQIPGLTILPCGRAEADPADLLSEARMQALLRLVKDKFDFIVIDSPPVIPFSEARLLSLASDAVVLVGRYGFTTRRAMSRGTELLEEVRAPIAGVVLNDMDLNSADYHYYNYGFSRGAYGRLENESRRATANAATSDRGEAESNGQARPEAAPPDKRGPDDQSKGAHA